MDPNINRLKRFSDALGYKFKNIEFLADAIYNQVDFYPLMGDAVIYFLVTNLAIKLEERSGVSHPPKGRLNDIRENLKNARGLATMLHELNLDDETWRIAGYNILKGERRLANRNLQPLGDWKEAELFEAIIGAIYWDGGLKAAQDFLIQRVGIEERLSNERKRWFSL